MISWDLQGYNNGRLISIANGLPQLQSLNIIHCDNITDEGIRALANGLPKLQSLDISNCANITDAGIRALARGLSQLQSLNIMCCRNITDEGKEIVETINIKDDKMHDRVVRRYADGSVYEGDYIRTIRGMAEEWVDMLMVMCTKGITRTIKEAWPRSGSIC